MAMKIAGFENSLLNQFFKANQKVVPSMCREALKWRITVPRGIEWENLPPFLSRIFQEIDKRECRGSEITNSGRAGKASGVKQNAAGAWESHAELRSGRW